MSCPGCFLLLRTLLVEGLQTLVEDPGGYKLIPPNWAGGTPAAPGGLWGILRQLNPSSSLLGFIGNEAARKHPVLLPGVSVSFQPWVPKGPSVPRIRCESKPEPWGSTTSPRAAASPGSIVRGIYKK